MDKIEIVLPHEIEKRSFEMIEEELQQRHIVLDEMEKETFALLWGTNQDK